jgi:hypothetical protein
MTVVKQNGMHRGMTLGEMVRVSLKAAKCYVRATYDLANMIECLHLRLELDDWNHLSTILVNILEMMVAASAEWNHQDVNTDFMSLAWLQLLGDATVMWTAPQARIA